MGFKLISLKELQTKIASSFLGSPITHIEDVIESKDEISKHEVKLTSLGSGINIANEEDLEFVYNNRGELKDFIGTGTILISNGSKKDRIWDAQFDLRNQDNTDLKEYESIKIGNLEPETNKKITYSIIKSEDLSNAIQLTENIEVVNINLSSLPELEMDEEKKYDSLEINQENNQENQIKKGSKKNDKEIIKNKREELEKLIQDKQKKIS